MILIETAAEPKSFANPDKGLISSPMRSTITSMAVLIISHKITNNTEQIRSNFSVKEISKKNDNVIENNNATNSCLKADSFVKSHEIALTEFFDAIYNRKNPLGLLVTSNNLLW